MPDRYRKPVISMIILTIILILCYTSPIWLKGDPTYMYLDQVRQSPDASHLFGTDYMGRDIFKMIWSGGMVSITIGILSTIISSVIAIFYGTLSGIGGRCVDSIMMRGTEIMLSIPSILLVIFIQAMLGKAGIMSLSIVIGFTSWMGISKIVRSEVHQIKNSDYILSTKLMGGALPYIIKKHMIPNFMPAIFFMVVSNIATAMATEATLSFLGLGLPVDTASWGSMMALSEKALLTNSWWIIIIPGLFLITTIMCITNIGEYIRSRNSLQYSL